MTRGTFFNWIVQQTGVPIIAFAWANVTSGLVQRIAGDDHLKSGVVQSAWQLVGVWGFGIALGLLIQKRYPAFARSGKWIWILPLSALCIAFARDLAIGAPRYVIAGYLGIDVGGETGLAMFLLVYPAWSSLSYSLAIFLAERVRQARATT